MLLRLMALVCLSLCVLAGTPTVQNGLRPTPPQELVFSEDLRFGGEGGDAYIWPLPSTNLDVDAKGNFYIADRRENRVLMFDAEGKFVKRLAKQGEGPGELLGLFSFTVLADGRAVAYDLKSGRFGRLIYFKSDMTLSHITEQPFGGEEHKVLRTLVISPDNRYMAGQYFHYDRSHFDGDLGKSGLFTTDFKLVRDYSSVSLPRLDFSRLEDSDYWTQFLAGHFRGMFQPNGLFAFDGLGHLYTALSGTYAVTRSSLAKGVKEELRFGREYKPILRNDAQVDGWVELILSEASTNFLMGPVNDRVVRKAFANADPSPAKEPIFGLVALEDGRLLVVHDVDLGTGVDSADLFSKDGKFLAQGRLPNHGMVGFSARFFTRLIFKNGFAYTIETDESGDTYAVRYRYALKPSR